MLASRAWTPSVASRTRSETSAASRCLRAGGRVGDEVPLVDDDDDGAAGLVGVTADVGVEGVDAFGGVEDEERDIGGLEVLAGHDDGELLGHELGLALAADAGGVDETEVVAGAGDDFIYSIPSCTGYRTDDGAVGAGEGVEQGGLADVGTADDGDFGFVGFEGAVGAEETGTIGVVVSC